MGLLFAVVYLMYAPIQWISWANFHPEALVITPLLFAWWFATQRRWRAMFVALADRPVDPRGHRAGRDHAGRRPGDHVSTRQGPTTATGMMARGDVSALGVVWYVVATRIVIPHFNQGKQPFYIQYFYGNYGKRHARDHRRRSSAIRTG